MSDSKKPDQFTRADVIGAAPFTEEDFDKILEQREAAEAFKNGYSNEMFFRRLTATPGLARLPGYSVEKLPWMTIVSTPHREQPISAFLARLDAQRHAMFDAMAMPTKKPNKNTIVMHEGEIPEDADPDVTNIRMADVYELSSEAFTEKYGVTVTIAEPNPRPAMYAHQRRIMDEFSHGRYRHLDALMMPMPSMSGRLMPGRAPVTNYLEQAMQSDHMMKGASWLIGEWVHNQFSRSQKMHIPMPGDLMFVDYKTVGGQFDQIPVKLKPKYNKNKLSPMDYIRGYSGGKSQTFAALHQYELHKQDKEWGQWNRMIARQEKLRIAPLPRATLNVGTIGHCEGQPPHYMRKKLPALIHKLVQTL